MSFKSDVLIANQKYYLFYFIKNIIKRNTIYIVIDFNIISIIIKVDKTLKIRAHFY